VFDGVVVTAAPIAISSLFLEQMWHMQDSRGQILALAFRKRSLEPFKLFPLRSEPDLVDKKT